MVCFKYIDIDTKCFKSDHENIIKFICNTCDGIILCEDCLPDHQGHTFNILSLEKQSIVQNFSDSIEIFKRDRYFYHEKLNFIESHYMETKKKASDCSSAIEEKFKKLFNQLQAEKMNYLKQIKVIQDENETKFEKIKSNIENKMETIDKAINKFENNNNNIDKLNDDQLLDLNKQYIEISKFNQTINEINKNLPQFGYICTYFNHISLLYNIDYKEKEKEISDYLSLKLKDLFSFEAINKILIGKYYYDVVDDFKKVPKNTSIAISDQFGIPTSIPKNVNNLIVFNSNSLPPNKNGYYDSITTLFIQNLSNSLTADSIPKNIKNLYLFDNFELLKDIIPKGVNFLSLYNASKPMNKFSVPSTCTILQITNSFDINGVIPESVTDLSLGFIEKPIKNHSIPKSVKVLRLLNSFNHQLQKDIIPSSVSYLRINNPMYEIPIGSIPSSCEMLVFCEKLKFKLKNGVIPNSVKNLAFGADHPIDFGLIPESVKILQLYENFKQNLSTCFIPNTVKILFIGNINGHIDLLPATLEELYLFDGFNKSIPKDVYPHTLNTIRMLEVEYPILDFKLPKFIENIFISNKCTQKITKEIYEKVFSKLDQLNLYLASNHYLDFIKNIDPESLPKNISVIPYFDRD